MSEHGGPAAPGLQTALAAAGERARRFTVRVSDGSRGGGSGVICGGDGLVISNAHVVRGATARVEIHDGRTLTGRVVARDEARDLVALRVAATDLPAAELADPAALRPGELVLALGNPLGWTGAVTWGVVNALERYGSTELLRWVRADLQLVPGNSGGPLVDAAGRVVGINARVHGGAGLAIPASAVTALLARRGGGRTIGVAARPVGIAGLPGHATGLLVLRVDPGSVAAGAGLARGDVVVELAGEPLREPADLPVLAREAAPGTAIPLVALRGRRAVGLRLVLPPPATATAA